MFLLARFHRGREAQTDFATPLIAVPKVFRVAKTHMKGREKLNLRVWCEFPLESCVWKENETFRGFCWDVSL